MVYNKKTWTSLEVINTAEMQNIENGIADVDSRVTTIETQVLVPESIVEEVFTDREISALSTQTSSAVIVNDANLSTISVNNNGASSITASVFVNYADGGLFDTEPITSVTVADGEQKPITLNVNFYSLKVEVTNNDFMNSALVDLTVYTSYKRFDVNGVNVYDADRLDGADLEDIQAEIDADVEAHELKTIGVHGVSGIVLGSELFGMPNGVASLDENATVPAAQLPTITTGMLSSEIQLKLNTAAVNNLTADRDPTATDDTDDGYTPGSTWINNSSKEAFRCVDNTFGAAVWINTTLDISELATVAISGKHNDLVDSRPYDMFGGSAILDGSGNLMAQGNTLYLVRDTEGKIRIHDRTSLQCFIYGDRIDDNDWQGFIYSGGSGKEILHAGMKAVANGLATLDSNGDVILAQIPGIITSHLTDTANPHGVTKSQIGLGNVDDVRQIPLTEKGVAGGVATLDVSGKIPVTQTPNHNNLDGLQAAGSDVTYGHVTAASQTIAGVKTFSSIPVGPSSNPTTSNQLTRKQYVDDQVAATKNYVDTNFLSVAGGVLSGALSITDITLSKETGKFKVDIPTATDVLEFNIGATAIGGISQNGVYFPNLSLTGGNLYGIEYLESFDGTGFLEFSTDTGDLTINALGDTVIQSQSTDIIRLGDYIDLYKPLRLNGVSLNGVFSIFGYSTSIYVNAILAMNNHKISGLAEPTSDQDAATKAYVDANSGGAIDVATVTTSTTLTTSNDVVLVNASSNAVTITLPAASAKTGQRYDIKKIDGSTNAVTVDANDSETIDGATTQVLNIEYETMTLISNGTAWYIL